MKIGDIFYVKKSFNGKYIKYLKMIEHYEHHFIHGNMYKIVSFSGSVDVGLEKIGENGNIYYFSNNNMKKMFYTKEEWRELKLDSILF